MFSNNQKISMRQTFRLFFFDFMGIGSLIIPPFLAKGAGADGIWCILIGGIMGFGYLFLLNRAERAMGVGLNIYLQTRTKKWLRKSFSIWLMIHSILVAGFCTYVFSLLMKKYLVQEEGYWLIAALILLISAYAVFGGIESRARVYEVLFWFVVLPLLGMLLWAVKDVDLEWMNSLFEAKTLPVFRGSYLVFLFFSVAFYLLFFPEYVEKKDGKTSLTRVVASAMGMAWILLLSIFWILQGCFGNRALAQMDFPVITLMSTIPMAGDFLKRLDALMLAVWFFSLYAVLNLHLFYSVQMTEQLLPMKKQRQSILLCTGIIYGVALLFDGIQNWMRNGFFGYIWYVGAPIFVLVPFWIVVGRRSNNGKKMVGNSSDSHDYSERMQG